MNKPLTFAIGDVVRMDNSDEFQVITKAAVFDSSCGPSSIKYAVNGCAWFSYSEIEFIRHADEQSLNFALRSGKDVEDEDDCDEDEDDYSFAVKATADQFKQLDKDLMTDSFLSEAFFDADEASIKHLHEILGIPLEELESAKSSEFRVYVPEEGQP